MHPITNASEKQDAFHWKQLRSLIGIHWPQRISNLKLYERCRCHQISTDVMNMRWRLFGHVLRLDEEVPANQTMSTYFQMAGLHGYRGRPRTLDTDLPQIGMRLKTRADLEQLRRITIDKTKWHKLHRTIQEKRCKRPSRLRKTLSSNNNNNASI